jgi:chromate transporter
VPAVALNAAIGLIPASWRRTGDARALKVRWLCYFVAGGASAATIGPYLVLVLLGCGLIEIAVQGGFTNSSAKSASFCSRLTATPVIGGLAALCWVAFKVGALSYGGGFVIIPLMQHDAVVTYHWMTGAQFLNAVALGQITPGPSSRRWRSSATPPVVSAAACWPPSSPSPRRSVSSSPVRSHFDRLRADARIQAFLTGAGAAVIGAIAGSAIPLGRELAHLWQLGVLGSAAIWLLGCGEQSFRRSSRPVCWASSP